MSNQKTRDATMDIHRANHKESPRLIQPKMATDYFTICGHVVSLKRNF